MFWHLLKQMCGVNLHRLKKKNQHYEYVAFLQHSNLEKNTFLSHFLQKMLQSILFIYFTQKNSAHFVVPASLLCVIIKSLQIGFTAVERILSWVSGTSEFWQQLLPAPKIELFSCYHFGLTTVHFSTFSSRLAEDSTVSNHIGDWCPVVPTNRLKVNFFFPHKGNICF